MKRNKLKFLNGLALFLVSFSMIGSVCSLPLSATEALNTEVGEIETSDDFVDISELYVEGKDGKPYLNTTKSELINDYGMTEQEASELLEYSETTKLEGNQPSMTISTPKERGFNGIMINVSSQTKKKSAKTIATIATGAVGWYANKLSASGPAGAAAAAVITNTVYNVTYNYVKRGTYRFALGVYIPGCAYLYNVYI